MRRPRGARLAVAAIVLAGAGLLVTSGLRDTLTYYRTPQEVLDQPDSAHQRLRLGGRVVPGSVRHTGDRTVFRLAEGGYEVTVFQRGMPPETFREGEGAVVEGSLTPDGVFEADQVLVRHGNEYRAADQPERAGAR